MSLVGGLAVAGGCGLSLAAAYRSHSQAQAAAIEALQGSAMVLEQGVTRSFGSVEVSLGRVAEQARLERTEQAVQGLLPMMRELLRGAPHIRQIVVAARDGRIVADTGGGAGLLDLGALGLDHGALGSVMRSLVVGTVFEGRFLASVEPMSGRQVLPVAISAGDHFVVIAGLNPDFFASMFEPAMNGAVAELVLTRLDGAQLASYPPRRRLPRAATDVLSPPLLQSDRGLVALPGGADAGPRLLSFKVSQFYPVAVLAVLSPADVTAAWIAAQKGLLALLGASPLVLGGLMLFLVRLVRYRMEFSALLLAKEAAEASSRAKADFLATMSHEIRTPMTGVLGTLGLLLEAPLSPPERQLAETAHHSAQALLGVLDSVLDLSRLEAGRMPLEPAPFSLARLLREVCDLMSHSASEKGLGLALDLDPEVPPTLIGDATRLRQVMFNLVGNAVKFTEQGGIIVTLRVVERRDGAAKLRVAVTDTGIGIDDQARHKLFSKFSQADSSIARRFGGTGLGLAISRQLVELMGGTITVDSTPGHGSTFWFELRLPVAPDDPPPAALAAAPAPVLPPLDILLAEDNPINRKLALALLKKGNHRVRVAVDGAQAVALASTERFDVVLMDMQMPEVDGLEATRRIRALPGAAGRVPIIALTANALPGDEQRCLDAGMDDYVAKPIDPKRLDRAIAGQIGFLVSEQRPPPS